MWLSFATTNLASSYGVLHRQYSVSSTAVDCRLAVAVFCFRLVASASRRADLLGEPAAAAVVVAGDGFALRFLFAEAAADNAAADAMFLL